LTEAVEVQSDHVAVVGGGSPVDPLRRQLLDRFARVISERGLTQTDAAMIAGVDQPTLSKALSGRLQTLTLDRIIGWLSAFGETVELAAPEVRPEADTGAILDCLQDPLYVVDADGRIRHINAAACAHFGVSIGDVLDRPLREALAATGSARFQAELARARAGESRRYELESVVHPGRMLDIRVTPIAGGCVAVLFSDVTARRDAEDELAASRERFQLAQDAARIGTYEYWIAESRMHWSDEVFRIYGLEPSATPPSVAAWREMLHPEDRTRADFRDLLGKPRPGVTYHTDFRAILPSGAVRWVESRTKVIGDAARGDLRYVGVNIDITERKLAEEALRESETRFRLIADSAPVPMWVTRLDRRREFVNRAYVDFLGIDYEDAIDFDWRHVIHPDDIARIFAEQVAKEAALQPFTLEARYRNAAGEWRWLRSESQPRWGVDGSHIGFIGVAYDVTIAKEAELRLQALVEDRTAELEALYRRTPTLLHSQSPDGRVISVSDKWLEFMGYSSRAEVIGRPIKDFMAAESHEAHDRDHWPGLLANGGFDDVEYKALKKNGEVADMLVSSRIWYDAQGRFARTMAAMVDVTGRRRTEEALRQSQKVEAMGQLTGGVAHDFNNLLSPIIGGLDFLQRRQVGGEREQRMIAGALQAAERAKTLVQRLLAFARRQPLQPTSVDLHQLVRGMEALVTSTMGPRIRVQVDVPADLPAAFADANQVEMALLNLSVNARDAMPAGGYLRIAARGQECPGDPARGLAPGSYVALTVTDDGIGMDEATLARAIEPFFSTKGIGRGTGLGLSMVHGLAAQLGGALTLSSAPGEGTTVELLLPAAANAVSSRSDDGEEAQAARAGRALLIDDEELVRGSTAAMLEELGFDVIQFECARNALAELEAGLAVDLVVTDHLMPDLTGAELARQLRERRPGLPVLIISGYAETDGIAADLPRLAKPFRQTDLARSLSKLPEAI
jgi:PAS domain S-box-containing protein